MPLSRISRDLLISSTCDFFNDCNKCTPTELGVCSFIKSFTATTLRPLWCHPIPWLCTKTNTISIIFAFFSLKYASHSTWLCFVLLHYSFSSLMISWNNFAIFLSSLPWGRFLRDPYWILVSPPENLPIFATKNCKSFPEGTTLPICWSGQFYFCHGAALEWNMWGLVEKMHCFLMLPRLQRQKVANRLSMLEIYLYLFSPASFPDPAAGTYHSDINILLEQSLLKPLQIF